MDYTHRLDEQDAIAASYEASDIVANMTPEEFNDWWDAAEKERDAAPPDDPAARERWRREQYFERADYEYERSRDR